jgi:outer membrane protein OmpA-like peptidoglycan-associated protein
MVEAKQVKAPRNMKSIRFAAVCIVLASAMVMGTGCKKLWPWGKKTTIKPGVSTEQTGGSFTDLPTPESAVGKGGVDDQGWSKTGDKMPPRAGEIVPIHDARWDGVVVYFAYDSPAIGDAEKPKIETLAKYMKENEGYAIQVEGHCDERGNDEYNRGLGEKRALAIREYLVNLGIADSRIDTISYGRERPAVADATSEDQHAKNRRGEFVIGVRKGEGEAAPK